jgi:hypothetical protein
MPNYNKTGTRGNSLRFQKMEKAIRKIVNTKKRSPTKLEMKKIKSIK